MLIVSRVAVFGRSEYAENHKSNGRETWKGRLIRSDVLWDVESKLKRKTWVGKRLTTELRPAD